MESDSEEEAHVDKKVPVYFRASNPELMFEKWVPTEAPFVDAKLK